MILPPPFLRSVDFSPAFMTAIRALRYAPQPLWQVIQAYEKSTTLRKGGGNNTLHKIYDSLNAASVEAEYLSHSKILKNEIAQNLSKCQSWFLGQ